MKAIKLIVALVACFGTFTSFAQADVNEMLSALESMPTTEQPECGSNQLMIRNPFLMETFEAHRSSTGCNTDVDLNTAEILTIPVVFHVMHTGQVYGEGANITDEQIISAIDNLNERFRADTGAMANYTDQYGTILYDEDELGLAVDSKIEFCLAVRDPEGNATDGITRHNLSSYDEYMVNGVSTSAFYAGMNDLAMKNIACWDPDLYLNIYIVTEIQGNNGGGGIQGYAYLGPTNDCRDGIVLLYNVTGTVGTLKSGRDANTTLAHEAGHYMSLYHTFDNGAPSCDYIESNCCTAGDRVCDTPVQTNNGYSCSTPVCDSNPSNYMDYTGQSCKTMFTEGQIERMRDALNFSRPELIGADNLACYPVNGLDVGITQLVMPEEWCQDNFSATLKISNFGNVEATGVTVSINGGFGYPVSPIDAGGFIIYTFSNIQIDEGPDFEFTVNWDSDENLDNNTANGTTILNDELKWVEVTVTPDVWSNELDWELIDESGEVVMYDGDWPVFNTDPKTKAACLPLGCYEFVITDISGDGMSNPFSNSGSYTITVDGVAVVNYQNPSCPVPDEGPCEGDWSERIEEFCVTNCPTLSCPGDLDGDGAVAISDLLILLTWAGQSGECLPGDLDGNGVVGVNDVVQLMLYFGEACFDDPEGSIQLYLKSLEGSDLDVINKQYYNIQGVPVKWDADLPSGIYIVVETLEDGTVRSRKIYQFR
jgi:hypothetical protein